MSRVDKDLVQELRAVDQAVLKAVITMIGTLRKAPDLRTADLKLTEYGIDERSPDWTRFMGVVDRLYLQEPGSSHVALARRLDEFDKAVTAALKRGAR